MNTPKNDNAVLYATYISLYVNDIACNSIYDIKPYVADKDKETRKIYGALKKRADHYFAHVSKVVKLDGSYFLADFNQVIDECADKPMEMLVKTIKGCLRKYNIEDDGLICNTIVAHILVETAVTVVTTLSDEMKKEDGWKRGLDGWKLTEIRRVTRNLYFWVCRKIEDGVIQEINRVVEPITSLFSSSVFGYNNFEKAYENAVFRDREKNNENNT